MNVTVSDLTTVAGLGFAVYVALRSWKREKSAEDREARAEERAEKAEQQAKIAEAEAIAAERTAVGVRLEGMQGGGSAP